MCSSITLLLESCYKEYVESQMECNLPWNASTNTQKDRNCDLPGDYQKLTNIYDMFDSISLPELQVCLGYSHFCFPMKF